MSANTATKIPAITQIKGLPPLAVMALTAIKETIEVREGLHEPLDRFVSVRELADLILDDEKIVTYLGSGHNHDARYYTETEWNLTAKGDLNVAQAAGVPGTLGVGTNNQLIRANSGATLGIEYFSLLGTSNQVTVTHNAADTTLSLPQDIHSGANPTFNTLTLSNIVAGVADYDKFIVSDGGILKYRTGAEVLSDIGGAPYSFKTITGITNDVVADLAEDTLTLAVGNNKLSILGAAASDTVTFTVNEGNIDHDQLANFVGAKHINWTITGPEDVHDDRIAASSVTQHVGSIDHNSLLNTHNLTSHIDHGSISGLGDSADHAWALLVDGTRPLTADWNIGNFQFGINKVPSYPLDIAYSPGGAAARTLNVNTTPSGTGSGAGQSHYGIYNRVYSTFDQDAYSANLYGTYLSTMATGAYQNVQGVYNYTSYTGATSITSIQGFNNFAYNDSSGTVGTLYGIWGLAGHTGAGTTNSAYGVYSSVVCQDASGTLGTGYAYYAYLNHQSGTANTGYLFRGNYFGTWGTKWGIRLTNETKNYLSGYLGIGDSTNTEKLNVAGNLMLSGNAFSYIKGDTVDVNGDSALALVGAATRLHYVGSAGVGATSQGRFMAYYGGFATSTVIQMFHTGVTGIIQSNSGNLELIAIAAGSMLLKTTNTTRITISSGGKVGIATTPSALLDVNSDILRLRTAKTPASAGAAGNAGDICWDSGNIYVCVATNTWKKAPIATW